MRSVYIRVPSSCDCQGVQWTPSFQNKWSKWDHKVGPSLAELKNTHYRWSIELLVRLNGSPCGFDGGLKLPKLLHCIDHLLSCFSWYWLKKTTYLKLWFMLKNMSSENKSQNQIMLFWTVAHLWNFFITLLRDILKNVIII